MEAQTVPPVVETVRRNSENKNSINAAQLFDGVSELAKSGAVKPKEKIRLYRRSAEAIKKADSSTKDAFKDVVLNKIEAARITGDDYNIDSVKDTLAAAKNLGLKDSVPQLKKVIEYLESKYSVNDVPNRGRRRFLRAGAGLLAAAAVGGTVKSWGSILNNETVIASPLKDRTPVVPSPSPETKASPSPVTKEVSKTPEKPVNLVEKFLQPFIEEAMKRRAERAKNDPEYSKRVDQELNANRLNVLLFGYGEEHGDTYEDFGGSISMLSYDVKTGQISSISLSRDIRAPELEQSLPEDQRKAMPIRYVYREGKFDLMRKVAERATGLSADFQIVLKDTVIRDFIKEITEDLKVNVDKKHETAAYRLDGQEHGPSFIPQGEQIMNADKAMEFILAEDKLPDGKKDERSYRKNILMRAMKQRLTDKMKSNFLEAVPLLFQIKDFFGKKVNQKDITLDFDMDIFSNSLGGVANVMKEFAVNLGKSNIVLPEENISKEASIHDPFWGDGSVSRVHNIRNSAEARIGQDSPKILAEAQESKMPDWMLIPDGGDPYSGDLIKDYWGAVRKLVKAKITQ